MSWLAFNLVAASLVLLAVLLLRRPVAAMFGARAAYALWLAPLLRLVMPPLPSAAPTIAAASATDVYWARIVVPAAEQAAPIAAILLAIWAAGAIVMLAAHLVVHARFVRQALAEGRPLIVDGVSVDIVATRAVEGPMATGLIHRLILVPQDFEQRFTPDQRRFALLHEQLHHLRGDIWASAAALLAASALWFNPLAHLALGAFRRDMEAACDASLVARTGRDHVPAYAQTILASAARPVPRSLCALTSIDELKGRLMMLNATHGAGRKLAGLLLAGGIAAVGLAVAAPASADEPKTKEVRTVIIEHDGKGPAGAKWSGDPEHMKIDCPGKLTTVEADGGAGPDKKEKAKIVLCSKGGTTADQIKTLEGALARIDSNSDMDAGVKADIKAKLQAKIAELSR
jgi:beta-lactamase regulating signal transducer with metallopeptidase domain